MPLQIRKHTGPNNNPGRNHKLDIAWKCHPNATKQSRIALCIIYELVIQQYYGSGNPVNHKPIRRINWSKIYTQLRRLMPDLEVVVRSDGLPVEITNSKLAGRWVNFFHKSDKKTNGGYANNWIPNKSEHPEHNKELIVHILQVRKEVNLYLRKTLAFS